MNFKLLVLVALIPCMGSAPAQAQSNASGACNYYLNVSHLTFYFGAHSGCRSTSITFSGGIVGSYLYCSGGTLPPNSTVVFLGNDVYDGLYQCGFSNTVISVRNSSSVELISPGNTGFVPLFSGSGSSLTVGYALKVSVFEPYGYNSLLFGNRTAGFSWIFPTMNGTVGFRDTQLQMNEFGNATFNSTFSGLAANVPFGVYGPLASQIFYNRTNTSYGQTFGSKTFLIASSTMYRNRTVVYNPYEVDYSFFAYDQLVMFRLNITHDTNLTPIYTYPLYPRFNFNMVPDNGTNRIGIKYLISIPPQDSNWSGTAYIYRYSPGDFSLNPLLQGPGRHSVIVPLEQLPIPGSRAGGNATTLYASYNAVVGLGLNSSIMSIVGSIPGLGSFVQDSTTPSFGFGLGYCNTAYNSAAPVPGLIINRSGTYDMVGGTLYPLYGSALPRLANSSCAIGAIVHGSGISIRCRGGSINDTYYGVIVYGSSGVSIDGCNMDGNGILVLNSSNVSVSNTSFSPGASGRYAFYIYNSTNITVRGAEVKPGFAVPFGIIASSGISVYNSTACNTTMSVRGIGAGNLPQNACFGQANAAGNGLSVALLAAVALLVAGYAYGMLHRAWKRPRRRHRRAKKG